MKKIISLFAILLGLTIILSGCSADVQDDNSITVESDDGSSTSSQDSSDETVDEEFDTSSEEDVEIGELI